MKRISIRTKVEFYKVCISYIIYFLLFYFMTILIPFLPARFVVSLSLGEKSSGSSGQNDTGRKREMIQINGGG